MAVFKLRRTGAHYSKFARAKGHVKAMIPRTFGARWLRPSGERQILLTFDDGPHPKHTEQVMDRLAALNARAIFFVLGRNVRQHPSLLKEIIDRGHVIGNHSDDHPSLPTLDRAGVRDEIARCQDAIADVLGEEPIYFRPPYGAASPTVWRAAQEARLELIQWSNEGGEYKGRMDMNADQIAKALGDSLHDDQIVLLHDDSELVVEMLGSPAFQEATAPYSLAVDIPRSLSGREIPHTRPRRASKPAPA